MVAYFNYNANYWRLRADEFRKLAEVIKGDDPRASMLRIAEHYELLATKADERAGIVRQPPPTVPSLPTSVALPWTLQDAPHPLELAAHTASSEPERPV